MQRTSSMPMAISFGYRDDTYPPSPPTSKRSFPTRGGGFGGQAQSVGSQLTTLSGLLGICIKRCKPLTQPLRSSNLCFYFFYSLSLSLSLCSMMQNLKGKQGHNWKKYKPLSAHKTFTRECIRCQWNWITPTHTLTQTHTHTHTHTRKRVWYVIKNTGKIENRIFFTICFHILCMFCFTTRCLLV